MPLYVAVMGLLVEEQVLKFLELLVQALNRFEVTIDDMVNQPVQEKPDALVLLPTPELHRRAPSPEGRTGQSPTPSGLIGTRTSWEAVPSLRTALLRLNG